MVSKTQNQQDSIKETEESEYAIIFYKMFFHATWNFNSKSIKDIPKTLILIICCAAFARISYAEPKQTSVKTQELAEKRLDIGGFPLVFYSDETRFGIGGGAQVMMDGDSERFSSSLGLMAFVTQNKQYTYILAPELYLDNDNYKLTGNFGYVYFPDSFYGIGKDSGKENSEDYTGRLCRINPILQRKIGQNFFFGIEYDFAYGHVSDTESGGQLASGNIPGGNGGESSGFGVNMTWDSRDNNVYPVNGSYHQFTASSYGSALGSDYTFNSYLIDVRHYRQVFGSHVIAFQGISCINSGKPSFQRMSDVSNLGKYLRGYTQNLFIDKNILVFQVEYRMPVRGRFGVVAFAGAGQVSDKISNMEFREFKPAGGMGIRFALIPDQKVNLRFDMGIGKDDSSVDFNLMESF